MSRVQDNIRRKRRSEKRKKRRESARPHYNLYLNKKHADHAEAAMTIERLLEVKKFTPAAVMGVRLYDELERGETALLFEKYGWIVDKIIANHILPPPDTSELERKIDNLEQAILTGLVKPANENAAKPAGLKPLSGAHALPMPIVDDDDTVVLRRDTNAGADALANFMDAAFGLQ